MNDTFVTRFNARLAELVAGLEYDYKPTPGEKRVPQIINPMLPSKTGAHLEGEEYPFVRWAIHQGSFRRKNPSPFSVFISAGIYTSGSIYDGWRDIMEFCLALGQVVEKPSYPPYVLDNDVKFLLGDPDRGFEGMHPHPYYYAELRLQFASPTNHK